MYKAYSAPGKALLAGGFLVLDPEYPSYVTALSSRMHACIKQGESSSFSSIKIDSPQFNGEWEYHFSENFDTVKDIEDRRNPFIEATIKTLLAYLSPTERFNIQITIFSDPGYHAQDNTVNKRNFLFHGKPIENVAKTGLGSSAGLVSVLTTAIIMFFQPNLSLNDVKTKNIIHNAAQIAHCFAQKKVGLGFDVATAIFGSIRYQRFSPKIINDFFAAGENFDHVEISTIIEEDWEFTADPVTLPPGIKLVMGDIKGGSETPKLVGKVLGWKKEFVEESTLLYKDLNNANIALIESLEELHDLHKNDAESYQTQIEKLSAISISTNNASLCIGPFEKLIQSIKDIRLNLRRLTKFSGAEIEPIEQTELLDSCNLIPGVIGGVVPGAGGYDAICLLVVEKAIKNVLDSTSEKLSSVTWLDLNEEADGVLEENPSKYEGLIN